jgi:hypothetical protein
MAALGRSCELVHHVFLWSMVSLWTLASIAFCMAIVGSVVEGFLDLSNGTLKSPWCVHTLFSVECHVYFDWQMVKSPLSMNFGRISTSKCRGKLQKMGVLYIHSPKSPGPFLKLPKIHFSNIKKFQKIGTA